VADDHDRKRQFRRAQARLRAAIIRDKTLKPTTRLVGHEIADMINFDTGYAWPSQETLAKALGLAERTVRSAVEQMNRKHFVIERDGRSNRYFPIWPTETPANFAGVIPAKHDTDTGKTRHPTPAKNHPLSYLSKPIDDPLSPNPHSNALHEGGQSREEPTGETELTFDAFWTSIRQEPGPKGPALAAWHKLSSSERISISNLDGTHGLDLDGVWACTWLRERRWEAAHRKFEDRVNAMLAALPPPERHVDLKPYSAEWTAERNRKIAAGEPVKLMDAWALEGRCWSVLADALTQRAAE
jgi:hypothetical protein